MEGEGRDCMEILFALESFFYLLPFMLVHWEQHIQNEFTYIDLCVMCVKNCVCVLMTEASEFTIENIKMKYFNTLPTSFVSISSCPRC
jgi:hypothetical protein